MDLRLFLTKDFLPLKSKIANENTTTALVNRFCEPTTDH